MFCIFVLLCSTAVLLPRTSHPFCKKKKKSQLEKKHKPLEKNMAFDQGQCSNWTGLTFANPLELTTEQPNASAWIHSLLKVIPRIPERNAFHMISRQQVGTL